MSFNGINDIFKELNERGLINLPNDAPKSEEELIEQRRQASELRCKMQNATKGNLNEKDGYDCPICLNRGSWIESRQRGKFFEEVMVMCKCNRTRKALRRLQESGLKEIVTDYRFDNFETSQEWQKEMLSIAKKFTNDFEGKWLFIGGTSGSGKSHICTATAITLLKKEKDVKYMLWRDEASRLKSLLNKGEYSEELEYYKEVDVLYIDDLFKTGKSENQRVQRPTSGDINLAYEILSSRNVRKKTTIISTECSLSDLMEIDEAIAGRIKQMCGEYCLSISKDKNKNYRMR